jgi:hypothetical protein
MSQCRVSRVESGESLFKWQSHDSHGARAFRCCAGGSLVEIAVLVLEVSRAKGWLEGYV